MFFKKIVFVYCLCFFLVKSSSGELIKKIVNKRSDIDLQMCIENFDVHKDKIIRTQDSKDMGAKYINEIDLGSREECLRLCCETENCDVFVFEEKVRSFVSFSNREFVKRKIKFMFYGLFDLLSK